MLKTIVDEFEILSADVDETLRAGEDPERATKRLAAEKARVVKQLRPEAIVIGADTLVAIEASGGWEIFGKPADSADAARILRRLSGRAHVVTTDVCVTGSFGELEFAVQSRVTFRDLGDGEIAEYVATGESLDKAGAYAIQGIAANFVREIKGSRSNIIGLPITELETALRPYRVGPGE